MYLRKKAELDEAHREQAMLKIDNSKEMKEFTKKQAKEVEAARPTTKDHT